MITLGVFSPVIQLPTNQHGWFHVIYCSVMSVPGLRRVCGNVPCVMFQASWIYLDDINKQILFMVKFGVRVYQLSHARLTPFLNAVAHSLPTES